VISPRLIGSRSRFVNCTFERSPATTRARRA